MPTTEYPKNPNTDTAFVTDDNNHRTRAVKTVQMDGTIDYPSNPNSDSCYVTVDGKKQRALMVADISSEGTLDYPQNSNSTKGYVTVNGKKQRVTLTASLVGGGSAPVIDELNVTPSTSAQTITAPEGTDGYNPVNVAAVTSAIDANITAGNIKKDVQILGVTGSYEGQTPTGTKSITANGVYDVTDFASADVQVPTTAPAHYIEKTVDANGMLINSALSFINLTGVTDIGPSSLSGQYKNVTFYSSVDLSSLTRISGIRACDSMFQLSTLPGVDLSSLTTISGISACDSMFRNSTLPSIDFSSLTTISGTNACVNMFTECYSLKSIKMNSLKTTVALGSSSLNVFAGTCYRLESVEFGGFTASTFSSVKNQLRYLFNTSTGSQAPNGCTVHFPSNFDPDNPNKTFDITTLTGYPTFGGNANYIHLAYDLPATE